MCLAIPGRITAIGEEQLLGRSGVVDFGGVHREVSLAYVPEAEVGDWVLVHVGFALNVVDEDEAARVRADLAELARQGEPAPLGGPVPDRSPPTDPAPGRPGPADEGANP
jgi:hydrogenase expression/formation protein HypC